MEMLNFVTKSRALVVKCDEQAFLNLLNYLRRSHQYKIVIAKSSQYDFDITERE